MLVTLALGDSRLVYAVICSTMDDLNSSGASIDESPRIPESLRERTASNVFPSVSQTKERKVRIVLLSTFVISPLLDYHGTPGTWSKFKSRIDPWLRVLHPRVSNLIFLRVINEWRIELSRTYDLSQFKSSSHVSLVQTTNRTTIFFFSHSLAHNYHKYSFSFRTSLCRFLIRFWHRRGGIPKVSLQPTDSVSDDLSLSAVNSENQLPTFIPRATRFWIQFYATRHRGWTRSREW